MTAVIKMANHLSPKNLWQGLARDERPKFSSSHAPFVKLEHKVITKWVEGGGQSVYNGPTYDRIKDEIIRILDDLDHVSGGWRYACRMGFFEGRPYSLTHYRHELAFQEKSDALMFKLRHP